VYGLRRQLDIANTLGCLAYQTWRSSQCTLQALYLCLTYTGVGIFLLRMLFAAQCGLGPEAGVWMHCGVHALGNAGNIALYVGLHAARSDA
jgi:hypothetical protein